MKHSPQNTNFIFCSFFPVGLEDYVEFFRHYFPDFYYLKWKFPHSKDKLADSELIRYKKGKICRKMRLLSFSLAAIPFFYFLFLPLNYLIYFFQSLSFIFIAKKKFTVFMGINYICAFCGIILRKLGRVDFVIYRVMDFFPMPAKGIYRPLTRIFYQLDKFCLNNADSIWFTTEGHIIGREKYGYFERKNFKYEMIPLGVNMSKITSIPLNKKNSHSLVYCGVVNRYHMLDLVFEALLILRKKFPDIILNMIGAGPDLGYYKELSVSKKLEKNVIFHGYMKEDGKFYKIMANNSLGIALYRDEENLMKYTEPAKVKYYLNFGLPAIISKVPQIAFELDKGKISFAIDNTVDSIVKTVTKYFSHPVIQKEYRKNVLNYLKQVDIDVLLTDRFNKLERIINKTI